MNALHIYRSSAGSGKTFTLVRHYLRLLLQQPGRYSRILAVTFTHKATAEMKGRILRALQEIAAGRQSALAQALQADLPNVDLPAAAQQALGLILHNYARFHVQTLESFFHQVVRSFSRELRIQLNAELELDPTDALQRSVDDFLDALAHDPELAAWVVMFVFRQMDDAKSWRIDKALLQLAGMLLQEKTDRVFPHGIQASGWSLPAAATLIKQLRKTIVDFDTALQNMATQAVGILHFHDLALDDCKGKGRGGAAYLFKLAKGDVSPPTESFRKLAANPGEWYAKDSPRKAIFVKAFDAGLQPILGQILAHYDTHIAAADAARAVLAKAYIAPLLLQLNQQLARYRDENRVLFMSDVGRLLANVIADNDAPFVYEKMGNRYQHFLLDEFQDTSARQWDNLLPLVVNALGSGHSTLIVGDVKQSIYRWRNSDLRLLLNLETDAQLQPFEQLFRPQLLSQNYRSAPQVVAFNNFFFEHAAQLLAQRLPPDARPRLQQAYAPQTVTQTSSAAALQAGYVLIRFVAKSADRTQIVLDQAKTLIDTLQSQGFSYGQMAILVRSNKEGALIAEHLAKQTDKAYPVTSSDALFISHAPRVQAVISALQWLANPMHDIALAHLAQCLHNHAIRYEGAAPDFADVRLRLQQRRRALLRLSLYECAEELLELLALHHPPDAALNRLLDEVLAHSLKGHRVATFLEWWYEKGDHIALQSTAGTDAIHILTIHKAKGLEFPVVMLPFADWPLAPDARKAELIWAKSEVPPYNAFAALPITPRREADPSSPFYHSYLEEIAATYVDNLNLLYVAFTRAAQRLYAFVPEAAEPKTETGHLSVAGLVQAVVRSAPASVGTYDPQSDVFMCGTEESPATPAAGTAKPPAPQTQPPIEPSGAWRNRLVIRPRAQTLLHLQTSGADARHNPLQWGAYVHGVIAAIGTAHTAEKDIEYAVARLRYDGLLDAAAAQTLRTQVLGLLAQPAIARFFTGDWHVLAEQSMLLPNGETLRPDRILVQPGSTRVPGGPALVVDFKTGKAYPNHAPQLVTYATHLRAMGYGPVQAFLVYVDDATVVPVATDN